MWMFIGGFVAGLIIGAVVSLIAASGRWFRDD